VYYAMMLERLADILSSRVCLWQYQNIWFLHIMHHYPTYATKI
jgi:hypothetical protein